MKKETSIEGKKSEDFAKGLKAALEKYHLEFLTTKRAGESRNNEEQPPSKKSKKRDIPSDQELSDALSGLHLRKLESEFEPLVEVSIQKQLYATISECGCSYRLTS